MTDYCVGFITAPKGAAAKKIAREIVRNKLAACVNVVPAIQSIYCWKGKIDEAGESLLIVKTKRICIKKLTAFVAGIHPYDVPEIIFLPIQAGHKPYLSWIKNETK
jgi:periplasmic divalent cation tolerance protein